MVLLSRVAERIYWGARYIERAEDTARVVRAFGDVFVDMPTSTFPAAVAWPPLAKLTGDRPPSDPAGGDPTRSMTAADEPTVVRHLVTDRAQPSSVVACVASSRENLRTTREVLPREAWTTLNDLWLFTEHEADQ